MRKCIVPGCRNTQQNKENTQGLSFHRIPKNEEKKLAWIKAIGLKQLPSISKNAVICSLHFTEELFDRTSACGLIRLRENAVPNIFIESSTYDEVHIIHESSAIREVEEGNEQLYSFEERTTIIDTSVQTSESFYMDLASRQKLLDELNTLRKKYTLLRNEMLNMKRRQLRRQKKVLSLKAKLRRQKKVLSLKPIVSDLKRKK